MTALPRKETSPHWRVSLLPALFLTRMAAGSCGQHGSRFPVASASQSLSRPLLHTSGPESGSSGLTQIGSHPCSGRAIAPVALATVDASAEGIGQILWMMRPSKLTAIAKSYEAKIADDLLSF